MTAAGGQYGLAIAAARPLNARGADRRKASSRIQNGWRPIVPIRIRQSWGCERFPVVNRQEPLIEKITCNHQFTHILCVLQALQKLDEQRPVFQRLGVAVFDTEVDIADDDDFVPNCIGRPQRRSVGIRTTAAPAAGSIQGGKCASARAKALDKISPGKFHFDSNEPVVVGGCIPHRVLRKL